jgi:hypothetical protein
MSELEPKHLQRRTIEIILGDRKYRIFHFR